MVSMVNRRRERERGFNAKELEAERVREARTNYIDTVRTLREAVRQIKKMREDMWQLIEENE